MRTPVPHCIDGKMILNVTTGNTTVNIFATVKKESLPGGLT